MPRSNQTKQLLAQSLQELMVTTPLEKISVNDIVDHAGVGRNTFYYHFEDKYDLVNWYFQSGITQFLVERSAYSSWDSLLTALEAYFLENKQPVYENPSPGNKAGGISTLEEKSLGCTQKSGKSGVKDVLTYGERLSAKGLNLLSAPGNDLVASTALAASGCHMVLFTTGRGTPFGTFIPTVKISTNTALSENKHGWIDFNAGTLAEGEAMEPLAEQFIRFIQDIAGGKQTNNERKGYREIAIFKSGVTL